MSKKKKGAEEELAPHEMGPPVDFKAHGGTDPENQANLIKVRQSMGIVTSKEVFAAAISKRAERIMLDYTQHGVGVQFDVDGLWHKMPPLDRQSGDMMLMVLKKLANLNETERRTRQDGQFSAGFRDARYMVDIVSQGVKTGERVLFKLVPRGSGFHTLEEIGMREKMIEQYRSLVGRPINPDETPATTGMIIFSAPPSGGGLSTLWNVGLKTTDRYMRDFVSFEPSNWHEPEVENIEIQKYDQAAGQTPESLLPSVMLKQPDVLLIPEPPTQKSFSELCRLVAKEEKMGFTSVRAKDATEALLRLLALKPDIEQFAKSVTGVINVRLVRRLCEECKQGFQPNPQLLQKLGIPQGRVAVLYREYQPPPPGQEPVKKGEEPQICRRCSGVGYRGRAGIFELMVINDKIRQALVKQPKPELIRQLSRQAGNRSLQEEGILLVARGITSLPELQRVMKQ